VTAVGRATTSDLSIDEVLLLHSVGWEPVDLVCGVSIISIRQGVWRWGVGEITEASYAHTEAVTRAVERIEKECRRVEGYGIVGVHVELEVQLHHVEAVLLGTAVRPLGETRPPTHPFVSDLSTRDFTLLHMPFAHHAVRFTAWGTAVRLGQGGHQFLRPQVVLPMDDAAATFDAASLREKR
jgi:uncharacterized protein YbjQ (UPF0145 family)